MADYVINGGRRLEGEIDVQKAKNSVLALISASILLSGETLIKDCPRISDVFVMLKILRRIGAKTYFCGTDLYIDTKDVFTTKLPEKLSSEIRASLFLVGPLLSRFKQATIFRSGGCSIGERPIDIHLDGLKRLGAEVFEQDNKVKFHAKRLVGTEIKLKYPSVGATENLMMASVFSEGVTILKNCAKEPEICDLQDFLNLAGAKIKGAGTSTIKIEGVKSLSSGVCFKPMFDRIEAGTFLLATLSCGGELTLNGVKSKNIYALIQKIQNNACKIYINNDNIYIRVNSRHKGFGNVVTAPYPRFPTDLHPQITACACCGDGKTFLTETVFDCRFSYAKELQKMGANIKFGGCRLEIQGGYLFGADVIAKDLRGGAALVIAGLSAQGKTVVSNVEHIERGYQDFCEKLSLLGADIKRRQ